MKKMRTNDIKGIIEALRQGEMVIVTLGNEGTFMVQPEFLTYHDKNSHDPEVDMEFWLGEFLTTPTVPGQRIRRSWRNFVRAHNGRHAWWIDRRIRYTARKRYFMVD